MLTSPLVGMPSSDFLPVVCDVTKEAEIRNLPQIIHKHWPDGGIDVLVNNAGEKARAVYRSIGCLTGSTARCFANHATKVGMRGPLQP